MKKNFFFILLFIIVLFGAVMRGIEVYSQNYLFGYDQGLYYRFVEEMVSSLKPRLIGTEVSIGGLFSGVFHGAGFYYLLSVFYLLFRGDPYGSIILMFLTGITTIFLSWFLGKDLLKGVGLLVFIFLIAASPPLIAQSRFLWSPHFIPLLFLGLLICMYRYIKTEKNLFLYVSIILAGLIYHFHIAVSLPLIVSLYVYYFLYGKKSLKTFMIMNLCVILVFLPNILFELRHRILISSLMGRSSLTQESANGSVSPGIVTYLANHFLDYYYNLLESFPFGRMTGVVGKNIFMGIFIVSVAWMYAKAAGIIKKFVRFILVNIFVTFIFFLFLNNKIWDYYLVNFHISYVLLFALVVQQLLPEIERRNNMNMKYRIGIIMLGVIMSGYCVLWGINSGYEFARFMTYELYDHGGPAKIKGKRELLDFIYADAEGKPFNVKVFTPPVYTYAYDYMFGWYGRKTYGYLPGNTESGLTYLIIEPDSEKPWSYKGWMETVLGKADTVWERTLPNGFIVHKRIYEQK